MEKEKQTIEVKATQVGFYDNKLIEKGKVFSIFKEEDFSEKWMRKLSEELEVEVEKKTERKQKNVNKDVI